MHKPVRVLQILGTTNRAGAETMIMNIYRSIDRTCVQFDFVNHRSSKGDYDDEIQMLGGIIYHSPRYSWNNHLKYLEWWNKFFDEHPYYPIVHSHIRSTAIYILGSAKRHGCITILHSHSISNGKGIKAIIKNTLQRSVVKYSDYLFACSEAAGKWLFGNKYFKIIHNAIDSEAFCYNQEVHTSTRKELGIAEDTLVIGHVGRFDPPKNHTFLIDVFSEVLKENPKACLLLVGQGGLLQSIKNRAIKKGIDKRVFFTGTSAHVNRLMQAMDIFVFPSQFEGLGISVIEAQASGLPCVVSDKVPREVAITNLLEFVALSNSAKAWAKRILDTATNLKRCKTSKKIIIAGYDIATTAEHMQEIYGKIASRKRYISERDQL